MMEELTYEMILKSWKESAKINEVSEDKELDVQCKEMIEKSIEKQIAKKPYIRKEYSMFNLWHCPSCDKIIPIGTKHCEECGQKLDWELTECE